MPDHSGITKPKQLLVEGVDEERFFAALFPHLSLSDIQIQNYGGKTRFRRFIRNFSLAPGIREQVTSIGIVRDADDSAEGAFQSVRDAIAATWLPVPIAPQVTAATDLRLSVLIMPDATSDGMLETLCLRAVQGDPAYECMEQYFSCLELKLPMLPTNMHKARVHAFLASRRQPDLRLGEAAQEGYWPWDHSAFDHLKQFLQML